MLRILFILLTLTTISSYAREPIAISYFDVGKLYDTIPSPFYDDRAYTPKGKMHWTRERYEQRVESVVAVIDSMNMPIVALFGVETEEVVREIVELSRGEYSYIHRTLDYYDGRDFALLYHGDRLFIDYIRSDYHSLYVAGEINDRKVDIHLVRRGDKLRTILSPIDGRTADITIVGGSLYTDDIRRLSLTNTLRESEYNGGGDTRGERGWYFKNRLTTSGEVESTRSGVYITPWLLSNREYEHLPIYLFIE